jgi:predicted nucleotidyltransferase
MIRFSALPDDIEERLSQAWEYLRSHRRVVFAYLFGGLTRGKPAPMSDVDIAVWLTSSRNADNIKLDLFDKLSEILGTDEIDLVILNACENLPLAAQILMTCKVVVDKAPFERHKFESLTMRKYFDFQPRELNILEAKVMRHSG